MSADNLGITAPRDVRFFNSASPTRYRFVLQTRPVEWDFGVGRARSSGLCCSVQSTFDTLIVVRLYSPRQRMSPLLGAV